MGRRGRQRKVIHDEDDDLDHAYDELPSRRATKTVSYKETDEDEDVDEELDGIKGLPDGTVLQDNGMQATELNNEEALDDDAYGEEGQDDFPKLRGRRGRRKDHISSQTMMNLKRIKLKNLKMKILFYPLTMRSL